MKSRLFISFFLLLCMQGFGQKINDTTIKISARFNEPMEYPYRIDSLWLTKNHCIVISLDTMIINMIQIDSSYTIDSTGISRRGYSYYYGHKPQGFIDPDDSTIVHMAVEGVETSVFPMKDSPMLKNSKLLSVEISFTGADGQDPVSFPLEDGCLSKKSLDFLMSFSTNKQKRLDFSRKYFMVWIKPKVKLSNGKEIELVSIILYM